MTCNDVNGLLSSASSQGLSMRAYMHIHNEGNVFGGKRCVGTGVWTASYAHHETANLPNFKNPKPSNARDQHR